MDINIFIALLIYLFLFNENKIIKRLLLIYLIIYILSNLYKCFFKKVIEGADTIGEPIDYNKNIYNILNDNILLLQDVNSLKQYEKKLKEDITTIQNNLNVITPLIWKIRYTVDFTSLNGFNFGPNNSYRISAGDTFGKGNKIITNLTGYNITIITSGMYNSNSGSPYNNGFGSVIISNNSFPFTTGSPWGATERYVGSFYDITNNRFFNISIFYYVDYRPIIIIEQIIV